MFNETERETVQRGIGMALAKLKHHFADVERLCRYGTVNPHWDRSLIKATAGIVHDLLLLELDKDARKKKEEPEHEVPSLSD